MLKLVLLYNIVFLYVFFVAYCYVNPVWYIREIIFSLVLSHLFKKLRFGRFVVSYTLCTCFSLASPHVRGETTIWLGVMLHTFPNLVGPETGLSFNSAVPILLLRPFRTSSGVQSTRGLCTFHQLSWNRPENKIHTYFGPYIPFLKACRL